MNAVLHIWLKCWPVTVDNVLQETPQPKVTGGDIRRTRRSCCWEMTSDHPCICEMLSYQLHYATINVRRCAILHENDVLKASTLLKLWYYNIPQHISVPLSYDGTGLNSICSYLFKKVWSHDKGSVKPHHTVTLSGWDARIVPR
ncbi:hypothetical protein AVEN_127886-1 [Araneus ventricosus]|uniref:Uncharacterized protein n=1 Tax=Araneus ventricosus TaxID=182803 RepID=A0A4Y1ZYZ8_ARAVE|nr:hypothetical protein AVEN_127886-1 [Araneus ventricosus]